MINVEAHIAYGLMANAIRVITVIGIVLDALCHSVLYPVFRSIYVFFIEASP